MSVERFMNYRVFNEAVTAEQWAWKHYGDILNLDPESDLYNLIFSYTGSWYKVLNRLMRILPAIDSEDYETIDFKDYVEEREAIVFLNSILCSYSLPEPIVVYRFAHFSDIVKMSGHHVLWKDVCFTDKAFVSTTLVKDLLISFGKENGCSCILKIYLPQGMVGAYVSLKTENTLLDEQEFLLPPNITFKIIKVHYFTWPIQIDCVALLK